MRSRLVLALAILPAVSSAATFVVPTDRDMVRRSDAIVVGWALKSDSRLTADGGIETVTPLVVDEVIKGSFLPETIDIYEPGGTVDGRSELIAGVPKFGEGERVLVFLKQTG